jgi:hypothetical protein
MGPLAGAARLLTVWIVVAAVVAVTVAVGATAATAPVVMADGVAAATRSGAPTQGCPTAKRFREPGEVNPNTGRPFPRAMLYSYQVRMCARVCVRVCVCRFVCLRVCVCGRGHPLCPLLPSLDVRCPGCALPTLLRSAVVCQGSGNTFLRAMLERATGTVRALFPSAVWPASVAQHWVARLERTVLGFPTSLLHHTVASVVWWVCGGCFCRRVHWVPGRGPHPARAGFPR